MQPNLTPCTTPRSRENPGDSPHQVQLKAGQGFLPPQPYQANGHLCHLMNLPGSRFLICKVRSLTSDTSQISEWRPSVAWELGNGARALLPAFPVGLQRFSEAQRGGYLPCRNLRGMSFIHLSKPVDYTASRVNSGEFSSGPEVRTWHFHCGGSKFEPWWK